jgi:hypothetical protein
MNADEERSRRRQARTRIRAREFYGQASRFATLSLAICASVAAASASKADCRYGDSSEPEGAEVTFADNELHMCVSGQWIRDKDILAFIIVEKANLWSDRDATDETDYVKAACDGRRECALPATASWAGAERDPGGRRRLLVRYHCAKGSKDLPTSHRAKQVEENLALKLSCGDFNRGREIIVTPGFDDGVYGHRADTNGAPAPAAPLPAAPAPAAPAPAAPAPANPAPAVPAPSPR